MAPTPPAPARPRQVTWAGWVVVVASVLVVLSAYQRVAGLHSLEGQEAIEEFLAEPPGSRLGLDLEAARTIVRALALVAGGSAAAAAVLGVHVLRRSRSARLALSIVAVPLFVGGLAVAGLLAGLVLVGVVTLWLQPARDWFAGIDAPSPSRAPAPAPMPAGAPAPASAPAGAPAPAPAPPPVTPERPPAVTWACVVTWSMCGLGVLVLGLTLAVVLAAPDLVLDETRRIDPSALDDAGLSEDELITWSRVIGAVGLVWCLVALALAGLAYAGFAGARVALVVCAALALVASTVSLLVGSVVMVVPLASSAAVVGLLLRPESRRWSRGRRAARDSVSS